MSADHAPMLALIAMSAAFQQSANCVKMDIPILHVVSVQLAFMFRAANLFLAVLALKPIHYVFNVLIQLIALFAK